MNKKAIIATILSIIVSSISYVRSQDQNRFGGPPIVAGVYRMNSNGVSILDTNVNAMWTGVCVTGTNGIRTQIYCSISNTLNPGVSIAFGSVLKESGPYYNTPNGKFAKCELRDSSGNLIPPKKGKSMEAKFEPRISVKSLPRRPTGVLKDIVGFRTNNGPRILGWFKIREVYEIKREDDYTLTICPVVYEMQTNYHFLDRVDLACVSTNIHLKPLGEGVTPP